MNKKIKTLFFGLSSVFLALVFQNCSDVQFKTKNSVCSFGENGCVNEPIPLGKNCYEQNYKQPDKISDGQALDVLVVTDTSGSLADERRQVAEGMSLLLGQLPSSADINMSIMLAHGDNSPYGGRLYALRSSDKVFRAKNKSQQDVNNYVIENLASSLPEDHETDGGEALLYSLYSSLFKNYQEIQAEGFYRNNANLVIVMITDENDICSLGSYPRKERSTPVYDPNQNEYPAYDKYCLNEQGQEVVTPLVIKNALSDYKANSQTFVHSITYLDPNLVPRAGENEIGYGVIDLVDAMNGVKVDMGMATRDQNHIPTQLSKIGELTQQQLGFLKTQFSLNTDQTIDEQSIQVFVDGKANYDFQYDSTIKSVKVPNAGGESSQVDIQYCTSEQ